MFVDALTSILYATKKPLPSLVWPRSAGATLGRGPIPRAHFASEAWSRQRYGSAGPGGVRASVMALVYVGETLHLVVTLSPSCLRINSAKGLCLPGRCFASLSMTNWAGTFATQYWWERDFLPCALGNDVSAIVRRGAFGITCNPAEPAGQVAAVKRGVDRGDS
jgi:hypothetical protein